MDESQAKKPNHYVDIDRISNLPDVVLCKILSYLPTKNAIATQILSTKWKNVSPFLDLPITVDLDDSLFLNPTKTKSKKPSITFKRFVDKLMYRTLADEPEIDVMILKCHKNYNVCNISSWFDEYDIRKLVLRVRLNVSSYILLRAVSNSTKLTHFELGKGISIRVPDEFTLPNLKVLVLYKIVFGVNGREDMIRDLIAGCPVLEELCLSNCNLQHWGRAVIASRAIKKLSLKDCWLDECSCELELDVPNLEVLVYDDCVAAKYYLSGFQSLVFAHIDVGLSEEEIHLHEAAGCDAMENGLWYANGVGMVVTACSGTNPLFLATQSISVLQRSSEQLPMFQNLTFLELGCVWRSEGWELLSRLLCNAPRLEKLTIREGFGMHEGGYPSFLSVLAKPPICLEMHVREIEFCVFDEEEDEIKLVEYFLIHGKAIQKVTLRCLPFKKSRSDSRLTCYKTIQRSSLNRDRLSKSKSVESSDQFSFLNLIELVLLIPCSSLNYWRN